MAKEGGMNIRHLFLSVVFCMAVLISFSVLADEEVYNIYVDSNAGGFQDGTVEYPYNTIQQAVDSCKLGYKNIIIISGGSYDEEVNIQGYGGIATDYPDISICGKPGEIVILKPWILIKDLYKDVGKIEISNINFIGFWDGDDPFNPDGTWKGGAGGVGIIESNCTVDIHNCSFSDDEYLSMEGAIGIINTNLDNKNKICIYNNTFSNKGWFAIVMCGSGYSDKSWESNIKVYNNVFYEDSGGVALGDSSVAVFNNTFFKSKWTINCGAQSSGNIISFYNNIVYKPKEKGVYCLTYPYPWVRAYCNDIYTENGILPIEKQGNNVGAAKNINVDPGFVDVNIPFLHLKNGSPCIDTGFGIAGNDKDNSRTDMGAYGGPYSM